MPTRNPSTNPLTDSQSELVAKVASMQSLLNVPLNKNKNIPKNKQISTFDYLQKIMNSLGLQPDLAFSMALDKVFDPAGTFLEDSVLGSLADTIAKKGISLPNINQGTNGLDAATISSFSKQNAAYLIGAIPSNFLSNAKDQIAKNLMLMIFGGKDTPAGSYLNSDPNERDRLVSSAVCAADNFDLSSLASINNQDLEYNRIALKKQLDAGEVEFEISCQKVKIKMPENPAFIFEGGGTETIEGQTINPAQNLEIMVDHVITETQRINNESNSQQAGKSFFRILIEKMTGYMSTLIESFLDPIFNNIQQTPAGSELTKNNTLYDSCTLLNDPDNQEKKEFPEKIANKILKALLSIMLLMVIKEFKKLVSNYFARTFLEKQRRKAEKIKARFGMIGKLADTAGKAQKYASAASSLSSIISPENLA